MAKNIIGFRTSFSNSRIASSSIAGSAHPFAKRTDSLLTFSWKKRVDLGALLCLVRPFSYLFPIYTQALQKIIQEADRKNKIIFLQLITLSSKFNQHNTLIIILRSCNST